ncbi:PrsW family intramembrane metalloprotease [Nostoc sp. CENA67]|uniref:PrsW family intramembrane metalloprotease n=2 Tax=Amazonocrinis TaxID=2840440 RepID=A0A8J7HNB3_9NOST|nr:PrsW family intramembrane metalloprotease [Amazonocrinis nigriterrae CENA67]
MADFSLLLWAAIPPLLLLGCYYCRVQFAPSLLRLLLPFVLGAMSGFVALNLELVFENVANSVVNWQKIQYSLLGVALRQLVEVGPIEEGCKLVAVVASSCYFQRRYQLRPSSVFLFTIAIALGFTAQENWIYFYHGTASIFERSIGTPVHAMFSAPWGYALGIYFSSTMVSHQLMKLIPKAWINSVICHALVNVLSAAWRYSTPLNFLSYGLFPFLLWMFWRLEQLLRKVQGKPSIILISGHTSQYRYWQRGLVLFALMLGGNAIFGLFLLTKTLSPLSLSQIFELGVLYFIFSRFLLNFIFGFLAWVIYRYLRHFAEHRYLIRNL